MYANVCISEKSLWNWMTISIMNTQGSFLGRSKDDMNISLLGYLKEHLPSWNCDCIQTVINLNTNSLTHLHRKACDLITLIKCIGVGFWGSWYELVFLIAWLYCHHRALKWLCLSFLKYSWDMLVWSTRFVAWEKIFRRSIITPDSQCVWAVFITCHWDNNLIWQADWMLLKLKDFGCLTAHVKCSYEDLLHEENQEGCVTGLVCR